MTSSKDFHIEGNILIRYTGDDEQVVIPEEVTQIGKEAFYSCSDITSVTIPNSITSIENSAFEGCLNLHAIPEYNINFDR